MCIPKPNVFVGNWTIRSCVTPLIPHFSTAWRGHARESAGRQSAPREVEARDAPGSRKFDGRVADGHGPDRSYGLADTRWRGSAPLVRSGRVSKIMTTVMTIRCGYADDERSGVAGERSRQYRRRVLGNGDGTGVGRDRRRRGRFGSWCPPRPDRRLTRQRPAAAFRTRTSAPLASSSRSRDL
jgi:hypothetical protein